MKFFLLISLLFPTRREVWHKAIPIAQMDSAEWRTDSCCHVIRFSHYGKRTEYGWQIDHIQPRAKGGSDSLSNLQPLYWWNNESKGKKWPWRCGCE